MDLTIEELQEQLKKTETQLGEEIRKRKAAEESLIKSKETLKSFLMEMPVIILAIDDDGYLVFYNREFERVSGYSASEITDNSQLVDLLLPDQTDKSGSDIVTQGEWTILSNDGSEKTIAWSSISGYFPILGWKSWKVGLDITELKQSIARVNTLSGLLPICSNCKKIRDDKGYWNRLEAYIQNHSDAEFTHGVCPDCIDELYPELKD